MQKFQPIRSAPELTFWHELARRKVEEYKAHTPSHIPLVGHIQRSWGFGQNAIASNALSLGAESFLPLEDQVKPPPNRIYLPGVMHLCDTMESFTAFDRKEYMKKHGDDLWHRILEGTSITNGTTICPFVMVVFGDMKKLKMFYTLAFVTIVPPCPSVERISIQQGTDLFSDGAVLYGSVRPPPLAWWVEDRGDRLVCHGLDTTRQWIQERSKASAYLAIAETSTMETALGWPLRNLLAFVWSQLTPEQREDPFVLRVLSCRTDLSLSRCVTLSFPPCLDPTNHAYGQVVGWEKGGIRRVDLARTMDPLRLAASAADLNLKLMKWRIMPRLDLEVIAQSSALILGAGTLGCNVARNLLGWGCRNITFVDNGKVSYSNPLRQSLYTFEDCAKGGKYKAVAAAEALSKIFPLANVGHHVLTIPMPGHAIPSHQQKKVQEAFTQLLELIQQHSVVFLLVDSREARWLPTMLCAATKTLCMNAALGFDTYLSMRHGISGNDATLGCYFCNDVVAPRDSLSDRTLDQQCTVTRQGVSVIASALVVEMFVSLMQHPLGIHAPSDGPQSKPSTCLGIVPHQIRGFLSSYEQMFITGKQYTRCTACSPSVLEAFQRDGFAFVRDVCGNPSMLEDVTGLTKVKEQHCEVLEWSEEDEDLFFD